jgi:hypothetical protein
MARDFNSVAREGKTSREAGVGAKTASCNLRIKNRTSGNSNHQVRLVAATCWIDALCINQNDVEEKNNHVPFMREIYEYADTVSVWLGEDTAERNAEEMF